MGQRCDRCAVARHGHSLRPAEPGIELSRPARQPRQLPRQRAAADAAGPARGARRRDRARLRESDGAAVACDRAQQRRPHARVDGGLQRVVRPAARAPAGRDRPCRCRAPPAVDRLDPHLARPGRAGARLRQVGRPACVRRGRVRIAAACEADRADGAQRPDVRLPRRDRAGGKASPRCRSGRT